MSTTSTTSSVSTISSSSKWQNGNVPSDKCPQCLVQFDHIKRIRVTFSKIPLVLPCKHVVCEDCVRKTFALKTVTCSVCKERYPMVRDQLQKLTDHFPPHFSIMGYLIWNKSIYNRSNADLQLVSTGCTLKSKLSNSISDSEDREFENPSADSFEIQDMLASLKFQKCLEHNVSVNILCENCSENVCCYCFVENHPGHMAVHLYKLSDAETAELLTLKDQCKYVLKQLYISQAKVKELKIFDHKNVEIEIQRYFNEIHSQLYLIEKRLRDELSSLNIEDKTMESMSGLIKANIKRVAQVLNICNSIGGKEVNVRALFDEIKVIKDIPCRITADQESLEPIEFIANHNFENFDKDFLLKRSADIQYSLCPIDDWCNISLNSLEESQSETTASRPTKNTRSTSSTSSKQHKFEPNNKPEFKLKDDLIKVQVTHISSTERFYVQKCSDSNLLQNINLTVERRPKADLKHEDIQLGGIYGALYTVKNAGQWRRGRIKNIIDKGAEDSKYLVFFIDYGNTQELTIDRLKRLDPYTVKQPPCALQCKLTKTENSNFDESANVLIAQLIEEKEVWLKHIKVVNENVNEVDLLVANSGGNRSSIRDLLQQFKQTEPVNEEAMSPSRELKLFKNSKTFCIGQREDVIVNYVRDPDYLCVQLIQNIGAIEKLKHEMKAFYDSKYVSCIPVPSSDVIVKYEDPSHGVWHRARVVAVDVHNKQAEVLFVDWGGNATVSWQNIRILFENFTKIECQGIVVKLADLKPIESNWSPEAVNFLKEEVAKKNIFRMVVSNNNPLEVALFQSNKKFDICLNALLVDNNFAISSGNLSQTVSWPNKDFIEAIEKEDDDLSSQMIKKAEKLLLSDDSSTRPQSVHHQVTVISFESPDLIYIKFAVNRSKEEKLHRDLQIHYNETRSTKKHWKESEFCVVYDKQKKFYFRAVIKSLQQNLYVVYLFDYGRELKVKNDNIFVATEYFTHIPSLTYKCRLSGIRPAGDSGGWSILAKEILNKIFNTYKTVHIEKVESTGQDIKIMGVHMWYLLTIPGEALVPSKYKFVSINNMLLECGVAFVVNQDILKSDLVTVKKDVAESRGAAITYDTEVESSSADDDKECDNKTFWLEVNVNEQRVSTHPHVNWPPILPPQKTEFDAVLICVDSEGKFSIRDDDMQAVYADLEHNLKKLFSTIDMSINKNTEWQSGEICTILYEGTWYRGIVFDVEDSNHIHVEMIDFGSAHVIHPNDLYKQVMYPDMPPLIYKIQLYDVQPINGVMDERYVQGLLSIVSDNIRVVIKTNLDDPLPAAEVYLEDGRNLNNEIIKICPYLTRTKRENLRLLSSESELSLRCGSKELSPVEDFESAREENECSLNEEESLIDDKSDDNEKGQVDNLDGDQSCVKSDNSFTYVPLPEPIDGKLTVRIISVVGCQKVVFTTTSKEEESFNEDFIYLHEDIQSAASELPALDQIKVDQPCVCLKPNDEFWARGVVFSIENLDFGFVLVFFVDHGTIEMVHLQNIKVIKQDWLMLPVYNRIADINVEVLSANKVVKAYMNKLVRKNVELKIISLDPLKVHIYKGKDLYYQNFIKSGFFKLI